MANHYRVTYRRKTRKESNVETNVYDEGHYREIDLIADTEEEAKEIAARVHRKQFATEQEGVARHEAQVEDDGAKVAPLWPEYVDPINAHANYKLQGVEVLRRNV